MIKRVDPSIQVLPDKCKWESGSEEGVKWFARFCDPDVTQSSDKGEFGISDIHVIFVIFCVVFFAIVSSFCDFWFCDPDVAWSVDKGEFGLRI